MAEYCCPQCGAIPKRGIKEAKANGCLKSVPAHFLMDLAGHGSVEKTGELIAACCRDDEEIGLIRREFVAYDWERLRAACNSPKERTEEQQRINQRAISLLSDPELIQVFSLIDAAQASLNAERQRCLERWKGQTRH